MKFRKQSAAKSPPGVRRQAGGASAQPNARPAAGTTGRNEPQDKVTVRERQLNAFFKGVTAGLVLLDKDLRFVQINDTLAKLDGLPVQAHLGRTLAELLPEVAPMVEPYVRKVLATGKPILNIEITGETPEQPGVKRHWLESFFPVTGADGTPEGVGALVVEITERMRIEQALRESEDRYRSLVATSLDAVLLTVPDGRILGANEAACRMFGRSEGELIRVGWRRVMDASDPRLAPALEERTRTGRFHGELTLVRGDGSKFSAEISSAVFRNQAGEPRISLVIRDITERKRAEETLERERNLLRTLIDHIPDAIYVRDTANRFVLANETVARRMGAASPADLIGKTDADFYPAKQAAHFTALDREVLAGRALVNFEEDITHLDGKRRFILATKVPLRNAQGEVIALVGIGRDITDHKRVIKALRQSEARLHALMARLQAVREEERIHIAREIHDTFGHALTDLKFDLAWLGRRLTEAGVGSRTAIQRRIAAMGKRVEMEMESVRRISGELRPALLDTVGLVPAIEWLAKGFQARTRIRCRMVLPPAPLPLDGARSTAIYRVLQELLANVARHARATTVNIRLQAGAGWVELRVSDNGRGIPKSAVNDPHSLGLLGASERAGSLGGRLLIHGECNQGTTVTVRLPMAETSKKE